MALTLAARDRRATTCAQAIQLGIEYDPQPPFDAGSPAKAPADIVEAPARRQPLPERVLIGTGGGRPTATGRGPVVR